MSWQLSPGSFWTLCEVVYNWESSCEKGLIWKAFAPKDTAS